MIPFWIDRSSFGKPCKFHSPIYRDEDRRKISCSDVRSLEGMSLSIRNGHLIKSTATVLTSSTCNLRPYYRYSVRAMNICDARNRMNYKLNRNLTVASSFNCSIILKFSENGITLCWTCFCHSFNMRCRNSWLNGPQYDRNAVIRMAFPIDLNTYYINKTWRSSGSYPTSQYFVQKLCFVHSIGLFHLSNLILMYWHHHVVSVEHHNLLDKS